MKPLERNTDVALLHPAFRAKHAEITRALGAELLPFRLFEGYRHPERQDFLYGQGRSRPGGIVTKARAWESYHQYGLAGDYVLFENGKWSWDVSGKRRAWWFRLHEIARGAGLEPLGFELPHLQIAGLKIADLKAGTLPAGGDDSWRLNVAEARERFLNAQKAANA